MVTPDEQRAIQEENAKDDERFWEMMRDMNAAAAEDHRVASAAAEAKKAKHEGAAAEAGERLEATKARLAALERGESIAGGLRKKLDMAAAARAAGLTAKAIRRARLYASLTPVEFETALDRAKTVEAADRAMTREVRRVLRKRSE
jgi:hypothetical protein